MFKCAGIKLLIFLKYNSFFIPLVYKACFHNTSALVSTIIAPTLPVSIVQTSLLRMSNLQCIFNWKMKDKIHFPSAKMTVWKCNFPLNLFASSCVQIALLIREPGH